MDRWPRVASEAGVEELVRIWEARPVGKGKLHLIFVGVADRDDSVARPHWASHPLPFLDDLPVGRKNALADAGERFATPVCESCDQLVDECRGRFHRDGPFHIHLQLSQPNFSAALTACDFLVRCKFRSEYFDPCHPVSNNNGAVKGREERGRLEPNSSAISLLLRTALAHAKNHL